MLGFQKSHQFGPSAPGSRGMMEHRTPCARCSKLMRTDMGREHKQPFTGRFQFIGAARAWGRLRMVNINERKANDRVWICHVSTSGVGSVQMDGAQNDGIAEVAPETAGGNFQKFLAQFPFQRVATWMFVAVLSYQLKDFFGIFMGVFIISSIGNSFVHATNSIKALSPVPETPRRRILVLFFFASIIALMSVFGANTIPNIAREGVDFVQRLQNDSIWVVVLEKMRSGLGDNIMEQFERLMLLASSEDIVEASIKFGQVWTAERTNRLGMALQKLLRGYTDAAVGFTSALLSFVTRFTLQLLVSLILSFMMVWDFPTIKEGIQSLRSSRLSTVYYEVAPSLQVFGQLFGKALQAQARIAMVNTALTAIGLLSLQIPNVGLLSLFVFICGFIPVAGVFMSTSPMAFIALTEYGFLKLACVLALVTAIHFVEAYVLNPMIYSAHLKLHPLLVLSAIVIAEHSLGVWGLMLAVPLSVFALDYLIRGTDINDLYSAHFKDVL